MTDPEATQKEAQALTRAMPFTRLVDGGMDHGDARSLRARALAGEAWTTVARALGEARLRNGEEAHRAGHAASQRQLLLWAAAAFNFGQVALNSDTDDKRSLYRKFDQTIAQVAEHEPQLSRLDVDQPKGRQYAWALAPTNPAVATVVVWGGLSGWGTTYLSLARQLAARGIACILAEGPGQGRTRMDSGIVVDEDFLDGFGAFVQAATDHFGDRPVGIMGNSFGALYAARLAASDSMVAACVLNGAPTGPTVPAFRTAREQILSAFGQTSVTEADETVKLLAFDPARHRIGCPALVLHGGADVLVSRADIEGYFTGATGPIDLRVWDDGEHTIYNHAAERDLVVADWFCDVLTAV